MTTLTHPQIIKYLCGIFCIDIIDRFAVYRSVQNIATDYGDRNFGLSNLLRSPANKICNDKKKRALKNTSIKARSVLLVVKLMPVLTWN